jgi:hypothetical protein
MSYVTLNRIRLQYRHYLTNARTSTYFHNFHVSEMNRKRSLFLEHFCLIINGADDEDDAYVIPYLIAKPYFSDEYVVPGGTDGRWMGHIRGGVLEVHAPNLPTQTLLIAKYHNAFPLLEESGMPVYV